MKTRANHSKKNYLNSQKNHTYRWYDNIQSCLWDIKITNLKPEGCPNDLLEIYYFYISQTKSSLNKIFYKIVYHHIIYMYDFLVNLYDFFIVIYTDFHKDCMVCPRYVKKKTATDQRAPNLLVWPSTSWAQWTSTVDPCSPVSAWACSGFSSTLKKIVHFLKNNWLSYNGLWQPCTDAGTCSTSTSGKGSLGS